MPTSQQIDKPDMTTSNNFSSLSLMQKILSIIAILAFLGVAVISALLNKESSPEQQVINLMYIGLSVVGLIVLSGVTSRLPR